MPKSVHPRSDERWKTFRVRGIPGDHNEETLKTLLKRVLKLDDDFNGLSIRSLAINAVKPATKVATIDFEVVPLTLSNSSSTQASSWELEVTDSDDLSVSAAYYLQFDTAFLGLTTLASPPSESHKVEYVGKSIYGSHQS